MGLQPLQQGVQNGPHPLLLRRRVQIFPVELDIHHRGQGPLGHRNRSDKIVRLGLAGAVIAEEVIGSRPHSGRRRSSPVGGKPPVLEEGALRGLNECKIHPLLRQDGPVHLPLVGGHVHAEDLPLVGVRFVGQKDQAPPAQQAQGNQRSGG